jgi:molecular chaperone DnaK (HSP70)
MAKEIYGIDLGTTYSCIAEISELDKLPVVIKNSEELQTTASVVYFDEYDSPVVGGEAKRCMQQNPSRTVAFIKREMSNPSYSRTIGSNKISPVKISAMILKKLVDDANLNREYRGKSSIKDVVITVPAYFGNTERELTKQAGEAAGLNVLALLNEPTAAALSYGANKLEGKTFMVYDLGGGTFDVSIMRVTNGNLVTLSTDGDHHLGGVDWDTEIVNYVLSNCCCVDETYEDIKNTKDGGTLILAAEQCKKLLSKNEESPMRFRYKNRMYTRAIKRSTFEELTSDLLQKTMDVVHHAMSISTDRNASINEIILVGGSSYMPMVKNRLLKEFPGTKIRLDQFEPDLAVAKGAAIHAYNLANPLLGAAAGVRIAKDLGSRSYGIETHDSTTQEQLISNLILRTDPLVFEGTSTFWTSDDNQTSVHIAISENTSINRIIPRREGTRLCDQNITWGYPVPKHTIITAIVKRGSDGIVHIEVECQKKKVFFEIKPENSLSQLEMIRLKNELKNMQF